MPNQRNDEKSKWLFLWATVYIEAPKTDKQTTGRHECRESCPTTNTMLLL